jgi:hypothetical protein
MRFTAWMRRSKEVRTRWNRSSASSPVSSLTTIYDWMHDMFTAWGAIVHGDPAFSARPPADDEERFEDDPDAEAVEPGVAD